MKCPRDNSVLESQIYEGDVEADVCPSCHGMWLDKRELEQIEEIKEHDYSEELERIPNLIGNAYEMARQKKLAKIHCPKCSCELSNHEYAYCSQIIIDACPKCNGIWLDKGEIEALEVFFERSRIDAQKMRRGFWGSLRTLFKK